MYWTRGVQDIRSLELKPSLNPKAYLLNHLKRKTAHWGRLKHEGQSLVQRVNESWTYSLHTRCFRAGDRYDLRKVKRLIHQTDIYQSREIGIYWIRLRNLLNFECSSWTPKVWATSICGLCLVRSFRLKSSSPEHLNSGQTELIELSGVSRCHHKRSTKSLALKDRQHFGNNLESNLTLKATSGTAAAAELMISSLNAI